MKTPIPQDFTVTDSDREWAVRKGYPLHIPDVFLIDFKEYHEINETRHANWRLAFKRYIRMNSPSGGYYKHWVWERKVNDAKQMESEHHQRSTRVVYRKTPAGYGEKTVEIASMPDSTRALVERMRK